MKEYIERLDNNDFINENQDHSDRYNFAYKFLMNKNIKTIFDCACGIGYGSKLISKLPSLKRIIAIDIDKQAIQYAKKNNSDKKINYMVKDVLKYNSTTKAEAFISFETLEHIQADKDFINKIHSLLSDGGYLVLSTPNGYVTNRLQGKPKNPFHIREYFPKDLFKLVSGKFKIINVYGQHSPRLTSKLLNYLRTFHIYVILMTYLKDKLGLKKGIKKAGNVLDSKGKTLITSGNFKYSDVLIVIAKKI